MTSVTYLYYTAMFLITADRLVATLLNIRHKMVCTTHRTKWTIIFTWLLNIAIIIGLFVYSFFTKFGVFWLFAEPVHKVVELIVPATFTVLYLWFAIASYILMFVEYSRSRRSASSSPTHLSNFQLFKKSKFYVSVLLISTFLILMVIPYGFLILTKKGRLLINVLNMLSDTTDFVIYVVIYEPVYGTLKRYVNSTCRLFTRSYTRGHSVESDTTVVSLHLDEIVPLRDDMITEYLTNARRRSGRSMEKYDQP